ncbi:hypothetical protein [Leptospira interrogans]|nr:hypothetical protein [Leptospira interrogans]
MRGNLSNKTMDFEENPRDKRLEIRFDFFSEKSYNRAIEKLHGGY